MQSELLKSARFRREREASWRELEVIIQNVRERGFSRLPAEELQRLPGLYRSVISSLSVARAISLDQNLLEYLEALASRAYVVVYTDKRPAKDLLLEFLLARFPRAVFQHRWHVLLAAGLLALGTLCGFALTLADPERYLSFVPKDMAQGRTPDATTESLRQVLYSAPEESSGLALFASFLFTHNAKVGILSFCLGFVAGVPVALLLFGNGLILGAMAALYHSRGLGGEFLAWVLGHGVTELAAVALCGGAGLALAGAMLFPGRRTRARALAAAGRGTAPVVIGAMLMFFIAGLLEAYFRQLVTMLEIRWLVAAVTLVLWCWYFLVVGARARGAQPR